MTLEMKVPFCSSSTKGIFGSLAHLAQLGEGKLAHVGYSPRKQGCSFSSTIHEGGKEKENAFRLKQCLKYVFIYYSHSGTLQIIGQKELAEALIDSIDVKKAQFLKRRQAGKINFQLGWCHEGRCQGSNRRRRSIAWHWQERT